MKASEYNSVLPYNIKRIILSRGLKQCSVGEKAGYSKQQFNSLLNGRKIIKPCDALAIADVLGVEMNELYRKEAEESENI